MSFVKHFQPVSAPVGGVGHRREPRLWWHGQVAIRGASGGENLRSAIPCEPFLHWDGHHTKHAHATASWICWIFELCGKSPQLTMILLWTTKDWSWKYQVLGESSMVLAMCLIRYKGILQSSRSWSPFEILDIQILSKAEGICPTETVKLSNVRVHPSKSTMKPNHMGAS